MIRSAAVQDRVRALPKAELHVHLEASMRASTAAELADRYGLPAPRSGPFRDLGEFVVAYEDARALIGSLPDLRRVAAELVQDAAELGIVWSEVHLIPPTYGGRLGPDEAVLESVLDGFTSAEGASAAEVILGVNRGLPLEAAERSLRLATAYSGRGVVGLGLAGDEANYPPELFADVFRRARDAGLRALPHGGEAAGAGSVRTCVEALGATRVCHGVSAAEDRDVLRLLADRQVCLDVCPSSNVALGVAPSLEEHPLPRLLDAGVPVTLNSDGRLFSGTSANDEYAAASTTFGLGVRDLAAIARTSLTMSSCPAPGRDDALRQVSDWERSAGVIGV